ncbi:transferase [Streptomyces sp. NPDC087532]|uniref:transferase n=1 Tax=unclassified Streptomyces TaxID=2593676 RepID=UPI00332302C6
MTLSTERPTPRADCTAGPDGGIVFDLDPGGRAEGKAPELLLRLRGSKGDDGTLRLPLSPLGDGRLRAELPSTAEPAEGRWDVYVREPGAVDDGEVAVEPGIRDLRLLMDRAPRTGRVAVRIPYPTVDGRLALHCWIRSPHAEAGPVTFDRDGMTVEGTLYGTGLGDGARVEARPPGTGERVCRVPVTGKGDTFSFTLPLDRLATGPVTGKQLWTLWLVPGTSGGGPADGVRISRLLDDVWDRENIFVYPGHDVGEGARATPCYSAENDLCVRIEPGPTPEARSLSCTGP